MIKYRSRLPSQKKCETMTSYSKYLSALKEHVSRLEKLLQDIKDLADEQRRD